MAEAFTNEYGRGKVKALSAGTKPTSKVSPVEARKELDIKPGDLLFVMAGRNRRSIAMVKADTMRELAEKIVEGLEEGNH